MNTIHPALLAIVFFLTQLALGEIRAAEKEAAPTTIAELAPKPIPDEQNAAVYLEQIAADLLVFSRKHVRFSNTPDGVDFDERVDKGVSPTAGQLAAIRKILDDHSLIFEVLDKAAACEAYASQLDFTLPADLFIEQILDRIQLRTVARAVHWKITLLIAEGKRDEAVRLGTQLLRVGRFYENEPALVNCLVSVAVRMIAIDAINMAIRSGPIEPQVRTALLAELEAQCAPSLGKALRSERAIVLSNLNAMVAPARGLPNGIPPQLLQMQVRESNTMDRAIEATDKSWFEIKEEWDPANFPQSTIAPSIIAAFKAEARRLALTRCLRILIDLEEKRANIGNEASAISQLGLPAEAVSDPFSGEPLRLSRTEDGWVIYSVMENQTDDGGDFTDLKDYGLAPPGYLANPAP